MLNFLMSSEKFSILYSKGGSEFPVGWGDASSIGGGGGADVRRKHFSAKMYVKTKELAWGPPMMLSLQAYILNQQLKSHPCLI